jgi:hypothetical protein
MAPERLTVGAEQMGVHEPEAGCGQRGEDRRMPGMNTGVAP